MWKDSFLSALLWCDYLLLSNGSRGVVKKDLTVLLDFFLRETGVLVSPRTRLWPLLVGLQCCGSIPNFPLNALERAD